MSEVIYLDDVRKDGDVPVASAAPFSDPSVDDSVPILEVGDWTCPSASDYVEVKGVASKMPTFSELKALGEHLRQARAELYIAMRALYTQGKLFSASGRDADAHLCFDEIVERVPVREFDERAVCDEAVEVVHDVLCAKIETYEKEGRTEEARGYFESIIRSKPAYVVIFILKGKEAFGNGDFISAHSCLAPVLAVNPKNQDALIAQAQTYVAQRDFTNAHKCFDQLGRKRMMDPFLMNSRGYAYFAKGDFKKARKCFGDMLRFHPRNQFARNMEGQIYFAEGNLEKARECFEGVLKIFPDNRIATYFSAKILLRQGKKNEAKTFLISRLQRPPVNVPTLMLFALCTGPDDPVWDVFSSDPELGPEKVKKAKAVYRDQSVLEGEEHLLWQRNILWEEGALPINSMAAAGMVGDSTEVVA